MSIEDQIQRLSEIYSEEVLTRPTRTISLPGLKCEPRIIYTFLGFELQAGRKRINCPDMATARYLRIFAELGMPSVETPYDPTQTARLLAELEQGLETIKELLLAEKLDKKRHQSKLRRLYREIRERLRQSETQSKT
ncbi:MAG: hypothetical protein V3T61_03060 [Acidobacteriota bacterium]